VTHCPPSELGLLSELNLSKYYFNGMNDLDGTVPIEIGSFLTNRKGVHLLKNNLRRTIPTETGQWTKLFILALNEIFLSGTIPTEIGRPYVEISNSISVG
jgi:hypothetical protein